VRQGDHLLNDTQKETIYQMVAMGHTKRSIAKMLGIDESTVYRTLKRRSPQELLEERKEAMARIASKMTAHVEASIDQLEIPENASYVQRMTGIGIGTDKIAVLDRRLQEHEDREATGGPGVQVPNSIEALVGAIRNDLRGGGLLTLLQVRLDKDGDTLGESVRKLEEELSVKLIEAEVTKLEDLDVGGTGDGA
jgi:predicted transcriptional regulator